MRSSGSAAASGAGAAERSFDVLVVGAGMAGLACARQLAEAGLRVCIVEAAERVGGRVLTKRVEGQVLELGAEFVHGRPPELLALIREAGLTLTERTGSHMAFEDGRLQEADAEDEEARFAPLEKLREFAGPDVSFREYLERSGAMREADPRQAVLGYVEGFNAADADEISARSLGVQQAAENSIEGDRIAHLSEGYDRLPQFLAEKIKAAGGTIITNTRVAAIQWQPGRVSLQTDSGEFGAPKAVITLPLGVLQAGTIAMVPQPSNVLRAAAKMRMGPVCRFTLLFRERFWAEMPLPSAQGAGSLDDLSFLLDSEALPAVWWTAHPERTPCLTGWAGGPSAQRLLVLSAEELGALGCRALARLFQRSEAELLSRLEACVTHNWSADPCSVGAYSYVGVGGVDASWQMSEPVAQTLYFAGEHTDTTGHWGTVHGALRSGLRAAAQILENRQGLPSGDCADGRSSVSRP